MVGVGFSSMEMFNNYIRYGSFPYVVQLHNDPIQVEQYLDGLYSSIVYRDIETRLQISDKTILERIIKFIFDNIVSLMLIRKIANTITSLDKEVKPFNKINDHYPKYLLTLDELGKGSNK